MSDRIFIWLYACASLLFLFGCAVLVGRRQYDFAMLFALNAVVLAWCGGMKLAGRPDEDEDDDE